jgi:hypothetical protein
MMVEGAELLLTNSTLQGNGAAWAGTSLAGAISNSGGFIEVRNSLITENQNGAIYNYNDGELNLLETTVRGNVGGLPAVYNDGTMVIERSLIARNIGGDPRVVVSDAALENAGDMTVTNTTVSGNNLTGVGTTDGNLTLNYVSIVGNGNYGLFVSRLDTNSVMIGNTLMARNVRDCLTTDAMSIIRIGVNIDTDGTCDFTETYAREFILVDRLADNGGPTLTHALLPGSPAINAATGACPGEDQRNVDRPIGAACDVGAFEANEAGVAPSQTPVGEAMVTIIDDARCRTGPGFVYGDYDFFTSGQKTTVHGRSSDANWFFIQSLALPEKCWIGAAVIEFDPGVDPQNLPILQAPPTPTATLDPDETYDPTSTPQPTACPTLVNNPGNCK